MKSKDLTFEEAIENLEKIVTELESGELPLDKSVENFKKGMELSNYCSKLLDDAEKTISILVEKQDGTMKEENFEVE
ncbi:MAG: exodeoxyribonuclease VII small subunit [Clostridia bacterium]|nr:exodeoxyribonuclease VII small subunit [Clostridia bacterium]